MGVFAFCGDETMDDVRPMAHIGQSWAHRNAQRAHSQGNYPPAFVRVAKTYHPLIP
jgi:hypothetical protein